MSESLSPKRSESSAVTLLFIVARHRRDLCATLTRDFGSVPGFRIIVDRRRADRRLRAGAAPGPERRHRARRGHRIDHDLLTVGFAVVQISGARHRPDDTDESAADDFRCAV
jgi:hypothetical protein